MGHEAKVTMTYISHSSDLTYILIWCTNIGIISWYDLMFDLKINVGHCDLYFMVHWFCLISLRLFDIWRPNLGIMSQYDPIFYLKNKYRSLWPIFHGPVLVPFILKTIWCMNIILQDYESVWPDIWSQNKCMPLWPIFHGPVILSYILKTVWCMNIILRVSCSLKKEQGAFRKRVHGAHWVIRKGHILCVRAVRIRQKGYFQYNVEKY